MANVIAKTLFTAVNPRAGVFGRRVALDDLILTKDYPTSGGSLMLAGYRSLFEAEAATRLTAAGWHITGKANVGEFGIDLMGETSHFGAVTDAAGNFTSAGCAILRRLEADAVVGLEVNGAGLRAAACSGNVFLKPTYGVVSRFGTVAVACSGETVSITADNADTVADVLDILAGHDDKDGTSLPPAACARVTRAGAAAVVVAPITRVVVARGMYDAADADTRQLVDAAVAALRTQGLAVAETDAAADAIFAAARPAWNILMSAELCNNVNRFEGMKYGYHTADYLTIGELYTNSRTEAFGELLKDAILFGSDMLDTHNYDRCYDRALRIRRLVCETFARLFAGGAEGEGERETAGQTAILLPACSKRAFTPEDVAATPDLAFTENLFAAPALISGLPALVAGGVQLIGPALSDVALLRLAGASPTPAAPSDPDGEEA